jgi:glycosyltransferase involved in cell wall biosynthesis
VTAFNRPEKPLVSVVMPNYNNEKFIAESIRGVQNQSYGNIELIIVDDGSTDGSLEAVKKAAAGDGRVRIIPHARNMGLSSARNTALKNSKGYYIGFCDSDDIWLPEKLDIQIEAFDRNPEVGVVHGDSIIIDAAGNLTGERFGSIYATEKRIRDGFIFNDLIRANYISVPTVLLRRACFEGIGLFPENLKWLEDWMYMLRLANKCRFLYISEPVAKYRVHAGSSMHDEEGYDKSRLSAYPMMLSEFPSLEENIRAFLHQRMGRVLLGLGRPVESRRYLMKSLLKRPLSPKTLGYYFASFLLRPEVNVRKKKEAVNGKA